MRAPDNDQAGARQDAFDEVIWHRGNRDAIEGLEQKARTFRLSAGLALRLLGLVVGLVGLFGRWFFGLRLSIGGVGGVGVGDSLFEPVRGFGEFEVIPP